MPTLNWIGKDKVINHHMDVPYRVLEHSYSYELGGMNYELKNTLTSSLITQNSSGAIIHGDNLEALKALLPEYEGKIKCIYIDPPYNTGNEGWVYNDNVNDPKIKKWLGQVVGKEAEDLTRHDKWLCMMYPRLKLLHKLLSNDGAIFISIDDNEQANLKLICDEIWGGGNFINNIIWQKKFSPQNDARYFSDNHDFILCYAKSKSNWKRNLLSRTESQDARYKNIDDDPRGPWTSGDVSVKTYSASNDYSITTPSGRIVNPPSGYCWRFSKSKFEELVNDNRIWFGTKGDSVPRFKRFLTDVQQGVVPLTIWLHEEVGHNQSGKQDLKKIFDDSPVPFETPKTTQLIQKIISISCTPDDFVLDSFAGSGTTAHAVLNLNNQDGGNRKFILIEMEDYAENITAERVKRVMKTMINDELGMMNKNGSKIHNSSFITPNSMKFDFYELGQPLFLEDGNLNELVGVEKIRQYIYYTETKSVMSDELRVLNDELKGIQQSSSIDHPSFLGKYTDTAYYFHYQQNEVTTLDYSFLATLKTKAEQYVIYADNCLLTKDFMTKHNIIFKKIPRDITKF